MRGEPLRILQMTDTHSIADPDGEVDGVDSFAPLDKLLAVGEGE
jgi:hypothetical protein